MTSGRYAAQARGPPALWSADAHLAACVDCRARLAATVGPQLVDRGWARLDAELDAPVPGPIERLLVRVGVPDHTARLLAATPTLRLSWLLAVVATLALTAMLAHLAEPIVFLATAPLLPVAGVALSFGHEVDPTYEISLVAPMHTFRLVLLRCVAVLATTTGLSTAASLALPDLGMAALGWFLPSLALTVVSIALSPRLGPVAAATARSGPCRIMRVNIGKEVPRQIPMAQLWEKQHGFASIVEADERYPRYPDPHLVRFALPTIAEAASPHPLMLWWALLLALSSLARHEPAAWTSAISAC